MFFILCVIRDIRRFSVFMPLGDVCWEIYGRHRGFKQQGVLFNQICMLEELLLLYGMQRSISKQIL